METLWRLAGAAAGVASCREPGQTPHAWWVTDPRHPAGPAHALPLQLLLYRCAWALHLETAHQFTRKPYTLRLQTASIKYTDVDRPGQPNPHFRYKIMRNDTAAVQCMSPGGHMPTLQPLCTQRRRGQRGGGARYAVHLPTGVWERGDTLKHEGGGAVAEGSIPAPPHTRAQPPSPFACRSASPVVSHQAHTPATSVMPVH